MKDKHQLFDEYWANRHIDWHSQYEDKSDHARAAWIAGYNKGLEDGKALTVPKVNEE